MLLNLMELSKLNLEPQDWAKTLTNDPIFSLSPHPPLPLENCNFHILTFFRIEGNSLSGRCKDKIFYAKDKEENHFFSCSRKAQRFHLLGIVGLNLTVNFLLTVGDHVEEVRC